MPNIRQAIQEHLDDIGWSVDQLARALDGQLAAPAVREFIAGTATINSRELGLVMDVLGLDFTATSQAPQRTRPRTIETREPARFTLEDVPLSPEQAMAELRQLMHLLEVTRYQGQQGDPQILIQFMGNIYKTDPQHISFVRVMKQLGGARFNVRRFTLPIAKAPAVLLDAIKS